MNLQIIAYYLPQFHPFKENDEWWGKGFTEWTNVGKAKPLFKGHYQPKVPADLGYYDLRIPEVRQQQVELAKEAGVTGFCYWHYWFGNGFQVMNDIIDDVASSGKPDFPFCLGWANESWKAKFWNKDGKGDKILVEQVYGGEHDYRAHYEYVRSLVLNKNYIKVNGRPFFLVYKPLQFPQMREFIQLWNDWIKEDGIAESFYFVANLYDNRTKDSLLSMGFDAVTPDPGSRMIMHHKSLPKWIRAISMAYRSMFKKPLCLNYSTIEGYMLQQAFDNDERVLPFVLPQWDHTPRSGWKGYLLRISPNQFQNQAEHVLEMVKHKSNQIVMLKSWNEWAEGNYMEPDLKFGKSYIQALKSAISSVYKH